MKKLIVILVLSAALAAGAAADNLYTVMIGSAQEAQVLSASGIRAIAVITGGYLVISEESMATGLADAGLTITLVAQDISRDQIAMDGRLDRKNVDRYPLLYEDGNLRLFRVSAEKTLTPEVAGELIPVQNRQITITYRRALTLNPQMSMADIDLDSLIVKISQDSLTSYVARLAAFGTRVTGTDSCHAARDWIAAKFASFGYDSLYIDSFFGLFAGQNVVAVKVGSLYPDRQIVIGGHYDGVTNSPAADDNGSGVAGTLEMARILKDVETDMTFIFIAFDTEERGLYGSDHYAEAAAARGDRIVYMLNMDMIGNLPNTNMAKLYYGPVIAYSQLWGRLADSLVGITGVLSGPSGGSDHVGFLEEGYDVTFVQEGIFSSVYHSALDDPAHMNFEYMTRMVKASLATVFTVNTVLPPVIISSIRDVGNGQSLEVNWLPGDLSRIDHYYLYYTTVPATVPESLYIPKDSLRYRVDTLIENQAYSFYIVSFDAAGTSSLAVDKVTATPYSKPRAPEPLTALPLKGAIRVSWPLTNDELDFSHFAVMRDGAILPDQINDSAFIDDDPGLGATVHQYLVRAVDSDGNMSDTNGVTPASMKAAVLDPGRILAVNRSHKAASGLVDEMLTGQFLQQALHNLNFDYRSDTAYSPYVGVTLMDMVDYGVVILGAESGRTDNFGQEPEMGGIIDRMSYYLSIGGKLIIFGRWGDIYASGNSFDTVYFTPGMTDFDYTTYFNIFYRILPLSRLYSIGDSLFLQSDFVGAHGRASGYPDLVWDSAATAHHTGSSYAGVTGIPCASFPVLAGGAVDTLYTYDSSTDSVATEGQVIGWRSLGGLYEYVFFEFPLTFMNHDAAVAALRKAVDDMGISTAVDDGTERTPLPESFSLRQNFPNPFNPTTTIEFRNPESRPVKVTLAVFNLLGQQVRQLYDGLAQPGMTRVVWDGRDGNGAPAASGIYFYRLKLDQVTMTKKMILLK